MPTVPRGFLLGWECPWDLGLPMGSKGCCRVRGLYRAWGHQRGLLMPAGSMGAHGDGHLEVTVHHKAAVHVLQAQDDLGCIEPHLRLREDTVLGEVIMQVPPCGKGTSCHSTALCSPRDAPGGDFKAGAQGSPSPGDREQPRASHRS